MLGTNLSTFKINDLKKTLLKFNAAIIILILHACGTSSKLPPGEVLKSDMVAGNYQKVYDETKVIIEKNAAKNKPSSFDVLQMAGTSAFKLNNISDARKYLEQAVFLNPQDEDIYTTLVTLYKKIDNLSYEITTHENYQKYFPEGKNKASMDEAYFNACVRSENWDKSDQLFQKLDSNLSNTEVNLENYLIVCAHLKQIEAKNEKTNKILNIKPSNRKALETKAQALYLSAETRYTEEMELYNKHKTRKQYAILLKALDKSTNEFKAAKDIYEPLYKKDASPEIAKYLSNIYARLNNKQKSEHYKSLSN